MSDGVFMGPDIRKLTFYFIFLGMMNEKKKEAWIYLKNFQLILLWKSELVEDNMIRV